MSDNEEVDLCEIYTAKGKPCPFTARKKLKIVGKSVCRMHEKLCKSKYTEYKRICNKIWDKRCYRYLSSEEINEVKKFAEHCYLHRIEYNIKCCDGTIDKSHYGSLEKMERIIQRCDDQIFKREENNRKNKVSSITRSPRSTSLNSNRSSSSSSLGPTTPSSYSSIEDDEVFYGTKRIDEDVEGNWDD